MLVFGDLTTKIHVSFMQLIPYGCTQKHLCYQINTHNKFMHSNIFKYIATINCKFSTCTVGAKGCAANVFCETQTCGIDPYCCDTKWNVICEDIAKTRFPEECCRQRCHNHCVEDKYQPGCPTYPKCENQICTLDPYCCKTRWDKICENLAKKNEECCVLYLTATTTTTTTTIPAKTTAIPPKPPVNEN